MRRNKVVALLACTFLGLFLLCACSHSESADNLESGQSAASVDTGEVGSGTDSNEGESPEKEDGGTGERVQLDAAEYDKVKSVTIGGTSYTLPVSGADLAAAGWESVDPFEMEADDTGVIYWTPYSCNCYNATLDSYAKITFRNRTGHVISSLSEAEVAGIACWEGDLSDNSLIAIGDGVSMGDGFDDALAALGEPYSKAGTGGSAVIWYFDGPDETKLSINMLVDGESNEITSISSFMESY